MKLNHALANDWFGKLPIDMKRWIFSIYSEYVNACAKHPYFPDDHIHSASIVAEESGELVRAALRFAYENGRFYDMHHEAIQTAASALRFLIEVGELAERDKIISSYKTKK